jgi:hypothetical protein
MPLEVNYDDDEEIIQDKPKSQAPPKLDDSEAFPETGWAASTVDAKAPEKSFASLASEVLPPQKDQLDYSQPIKIKVPRKPLPARIKKVRDQYTRQHQSYVKTLDTNCIMYHDEGLPEGNDKKAPCESATVGKPVRSLKELEQCWTEVSKRRLEDGCNLRLFKSDISSPSHSDPACEKGGKYLLRVKKELSRDMFEELCLYFCDQRLDPAVTIGLCLCIRPKLDVIQIWTKNVASAASEELYGKNLNELLGTEASLKFVKHSEAYPKKLAEARKYYLEDKVSSDEQGAAMSVNNTFKPREFTKEKKEKKKGEFEKVPVKERKQSEKAEEEEAFVKEEPEGFSYDILADGNQDDGKEEPDDGLQILEKKKSEKTRKGSSKKGSSKSKKNKGDDFDFDGVSTKPIIPQQVFIGAGLFGVFFIAFLAMFMSGVMN